MIDMSANIGGDDNASYLKYLTFIQDVITRMNRNAFQLKGWCITIVTALAALETKTDGVSLLIVASIATLPFGLLDGYYLWMERRFRGLYSDVIKGCDSITLFEMSISRYTVKQDLKYGYWHVLCSGSVCGFYLTLFVLCVASWATCMWIGNKNGFQSQQDACQCALHECKCPFALSASYKEEKGGAFKCREEAFHWERKWK